jgi:hypothetical protein
VCIFSAGKRETPQIWALSEGFTNGHLFLSRDFWIVYFASALPAAYWRSFRESDRCRSNYRCDFLGLFRLNVERCSSAWFV